MNDLVDWTREVQPRERYRIEYADRDGEISLREIVLNKIGTMSGMSYFGVMHQGKFKTLRADRIHMVAQLSTGHDCSIRPQPTYATELPQFPVEGAVYKMPTVAASTRTWTVDLNAYTCSCPEKRIRLGFGYEPGRLGFVCPHMARAILDHLPGEAGWQPELLAFLANPKMIHIDNLS